MKEYTENETTSPEMASALLAIIEVRVEDRLTACLGFHPSPQERARLFKMFLPSLAESLVSGMPNVVFEKLAGEYDFRN